MTQLLMEQKTKILQRINIRNATNGLRHDDTLRRYLTSAAFALVNTFEEP